MTVNDREEFGLGELGENVALRGHGAQGTERTPQRVAFRTRAGIATSGEEHESGALHERQVVGNRNAWACIS